MRDRLTPRTVALLILGAVAAFYVLYYIPNFFAKVRVAQFTDVLAISIAVLGLALLTGFNGQISIGHGAFFGVGAYTTAILAADHGWPHLATIPVAAVICFGVGALTGLPALRIKGLYLALVTLALATLVPLVVIRFDWLTGGSQGLGVPDFEAPDWTGLAEDQWAYYVVLVFAVVLFLLVRNLVRSRPGRALIAIRDNETAAEVLGVNLSLYKVLVFGTSAMLAGIGGALKVCNTAVLDRVDPQQFTILKSIEFLAAMVIGGATAIFGPVIGTLFIIFVPERASDVSPELSNVIFGGLLIILMLLLPSGAIGGLRRLEASILRRTGRGPDWRKIPPSAEGAGDEQAEIAVAVGDPLSGPSGPSGP